MTKREINVLVEKIRGVSLSKQLEMIHRELLSQKVRFPMLEYFTQQWSVDILPTHYLPTVQQIGQHKTIGGNVLMGILLQKNLDHDFDATLNEMCSVLIDGNEWYVCDIVGERVLGYSLLTNPIKTLPELKRLSQHADKWVVRSVGVAVHYAVKKGLKKHYIAEVFELLLSLSTTTDFHTKKGIGWAAKTCAKFHPDIIQQFNTQIENTVVRQWFKTKIKIGLGRSDKYGQRYSG